MPNLVLLSFSVYWRTFLAHLMKIWFVCVFYRVVRIVNTLWHKPDLEYTSEPWSAEHLLEQGSEQLIHMPLGKHFMEICFVNFWIQKFCGIHFFRKIWTKKKLKAKNWKQKIETCCDNKIAGKFTFFLQWDTAKEYLNKSLLTQEFRHICFIFSDKAQYRTQTENGM